MFSSLSCSALKCYDTCPRRFKFEYVERLGASFRTGKPHLSFAKSIHSALADFFRKGVKEINRDLIQSALLSRWEKDGYRDSAEESAYFNRALDVIEKFLSAGGTKNTPLFIEDYFRVSVGEFSVTGRIDRIDVDTSGGVEIIDYKTGRYLPSVNEVFEDLQLRTYALAAFNKYRKVPGTITAHLLEHGLKISANLGICDIEKTSERIKSIFLKISSDKEFLPVTNRFCGSCDFNALCKLPGPYGIIEFSRALSDLMFNNALLKMKSQVDGLTKLYNRGYFEERLAEEINFAGTKKLPLSIIMLDVDHFKKVNDNYGHTAGDKVLCEVASIIKRHTGSEAVAARYGGEEFVCILPGKSAEDAASFGEKLRAEVAAAEFTVDGRCLGVTISAGIAELINPEKPWEIINSADKNLYQAKNSGRNRVVF